MGQRDYDETLSPQAFKHFKFPYTLHNPKYLSCQGVGVYDSMKMGMNNLALAERKITSTFESRCSFSRDSTPILLVLMLGSPDSRSATIGRHKIFEAHRSISGHRGFGNRIRGQVGSRAACLALESRIFGPSPREAAQLPQHVTVLREAPLIVLMLVGLPGSKARCYNPTVIHVAVSIVEMQPV